MPPRKTEPDPFDLHVVYLLGLGETALTAAAKMGHGRSWVRNRIRRLAGLTGTDTQAHLVYQLMSEGRIKYNLRPQYYKPNDEKLAVVRRFAEGESRQKICSEMYLSLGAVERRIKDARLMVGAKTLAHLVAICKTEGWIE